MGGTVFEDKAAAGDGVTGKLTSVKRFLETLRRVNKIPLAMN